MRFLALALMGSLCLATPALGQDDPFAAGVRPTEPLAPDQERLALRVPPGFEVQLVAAKPDIQKPLNMAFDDRGRLWITDTVEYPYAAPLDRPGRDTIKILQDTNGDGRYETITTFADGLNIPIGLYPYLDGVIAYSIPYIWHLQDTDGDGRCDQREKLYGPMGYERDTHGMNNAFRRGYDGWLYACHGFNNETRVKGTDGHEIHMHSGNTYRMRLDGSRVEHFTWGQVNPFGMTFDPLGNLFTADCHSKPISQLLRGAYYPSFGKPHDGLGFVPPMMDHLHGSTAIAGLALYDDNRFPPEYRGNLFSGNVMTSRVNRNSLVYHGSTIRAQERPDFVISDDPWFRPVDVQLGPDGALYVADFYNRIIGHYEVPLDHPGRDRHRGRIWRIVYKGDTEKLEVSPTLPPGHGRREGNSASKDPHPNPLSEGEETRDLTRATTNQLIVALDDDNQTYRMLALQRLVDVVGADAAKPVAEAFANSSSGRFRSHALWVLFRLKALTDEQLRSAATDPQRAPRIHAMKVLSEMPEWSDRHRQLALGGLNDSDAFVRRAAADALGQHPAYQHVRPLLDALATVPPEDNHLSHTIRMSLRNQLRDAANLVRLQESGELSPAETQIIAGITLGLPTPAAGAFLIEYLTKHEEPFAAWLRFVPHAARYAPDERITELVELARNRAGTETDRQVRLINAIQDGFDQRGLTSLAAIQDWAAEVAGPMLNAPRPPTFRWTFEPLADASRTENPWTVQPRRSADGDQDSLFFTSLPRGETLTGTYRSEPFPLPAKLTFYLAGHLGPPRQPVDPRNFVRLRDAASGEILQEITPPRHDVAQLIEWNLEQHAGKQGVLELIDGDERRAYAWLAAGRFSVPELNPSRDQERRTTALAVVARFRLQSLSVPVTRLLEDDTVPNELRAAAARTLLALRPNPLLSALLPILDEPLLPEPLRERLVASLIQRQPDTIPILWGDVMRTVPQRLQLVLAESLAGSPGGAELLLQLIERGQASARLLLRPSVRFRLALLKRPEIDARLENLTANVPSDNDTLQKLIAERRRQFAAADVSLQRGAEVFAKHCAACHQVDGQGALVGPQLDGIGNRGLERLLEDVLDPNRNVDVAFRTSTLVLADGRIVTGLLRREEGASLVFVDNQGKEFTVSADDVEERLRSEISLMPANLGETLPEEDLHHLMAFLLSKRTVPQPPEGLRAIEPRQ